MCVCEGLKFEGSRYRRLVVGMRIVRVMVMVVLDLKF